MVMELKSFQKLFQMTKVINSQFEMSEILQVFVDAIAGEITQADLVGFFLKQPDGTFQGYKGNKLPVDITELLIDPREDEFIRDILRNQASDYISDTSIDLRLDQSKRQLLKIKSILGIPVIVENDVFGLVFVHDFGKPMNITQEQMEVTEAFVNMASVAIRNIRMFEQRQLLMEKQQLLLDATKALSESLSVKDVLNTFFHYMRKASGSKDIGIHLYNEKEHTIEPYQLSSENVTVDEWKVKHREVKLTIENDRLLYEVITQKKSAAIEDVYADPRPNHKAFVSFGIRSIMVFPLVAKGSVYGVVAIPSIGKPRKYEASILEFCQSISDATATALSNAQHTETLDHSVSERSLELQHANFKLEGLVRELEHLNELKSDFIATLSHELRTPITAVKGSVDILSKGILGGLNDSQKDLLDIASKSIERLLDQVNELLDFAKMENGKFELVYTEADFKEIIKESVTIVQSLINKKKLILVVESDAETNTVVSVDKQRILQILLNLLSNAIKFTPPMGVITIKTIFEETVLTVEVHDSGIGIPYEKQKNIFTKFYQANNQINGTGLGLAISKQLIELHGGRIWFESTEGQGTVFKFTLPKGEE